MRNVTNERTITRPKSISSNRSIANGIPILSTISYNNVSKNSRFYLLYDLSCCAVRSLNLARTSPYLNGRRLKNHIQEGARRDDILHPYFNSILPEQKKKHRSREQVIGLLGFVISKDISTLFSFCSFFFFFLNKTFNIRSISVSSAKSTFCVGTDVKNFGGFHSLVTSRLHVQLDDSLNSPRSIQNISPKRSPRSIPLVCNQAILFNIYKVLSA